MMFLWMSLSDEHVSGDIGLQIPRYHFAKCDMKKELNCIS